MPNNLSGETVSGNQSDTVFVKVNRRQLIPLSFALAIVCFFFTFCNFKCQGNTLASVSGIDLVTGTSLEKKEFLAKGELKNSSISANAWAIISLMAAAAGLGIYLIKKNKEAIIGTIAGITGFISLVILQFDLKSMVKVKEAPIDIVFTLAYWLALAAMGLAALLSFMRVKK
ncbi:MAG: hypothetical protein ABIS69_08935 [Sediminibacterium sp.]